MLKKFSSGKVAFSYLMVLARADGLKSPIMQYDWEIKETDESLVERISAKTKLPLFLSRILANRGIQDPESASHFLEPKLEHLQNPHLLPDYAPAVDRLLQALSSGEKVLIWGDEDVDGVTATALAFETFQDLGFKVLYYIPNRDKEGFGLNTGSLDKIAQENVGLIITLDCGMSDFNEVGHAKSLGIDVVIADHHMPLEKLPPACAIINPKREDNPSFRDLTGAGIAYKIAQGIASEKLGISASQWHSVKEDLLSYALLGTIADRAPLLYENRILAKAGLDALFKSKRPWIKTIRELTGIRPEKGTSELFKSFIPLLSAGKSENGRNPACKLLLSQDIQEVEKLASKLQESSQSWHQRAKDAYMKVKAKVAPSGSKKGIVVADEELPPDVLGYCASKLAGEFSRPSVVIGCKGDTAVAEARTPAGFDLMDSLRALQGLLCDYGGHKLAAGFSIEPDKIEEFSKEWGECVQENFPHKQLRPNLQIDAKLPLGELDIDMIGKIKQLAPFGEGNPRPLLLSEKTGLKQIGGCYYLEDSGLELLRGGKFDWPFPTGQKVKADLVYSVRESGELLLIDYFPRA